MESAFTNAVNETVLESQGAADVSPPEPTEANASPADDTPVGDTSGVSTSAPPASTPPSSPQQRPKVRRRRRVDTALPPVRLTLRNQLDVLTVYGELSNSGTQGVAVTDVALRVQKSEATISTFSSFFKSVGFIRQEEGVTGFLPSPEVLNFANLRGYDEGKAIEQLRPLIEKSWFGREVVSEIKLHPNSTTTQLVAALALIANVNPKEKEYGAQLLQLVEWAYLTKLIERQKDGTYRLGAFSGTSVGAASGSPSEAQPKAEVSPAIKIGGFDAIVEAISNTPLSLEEIRKLTPEELQRLDEAIQTFTDFAAKFGKES